MKTELPLDTQIRIDDLTAVRRVVDHLLEGTRGPLLDLLAEDVEFEVAAGEGLPGRRKQRGKQAVDDYFMALGGLVAFWQMDYTRSGRQVVAWGKESFTVEHCGLEGECELALVFELRRGMITQLRVIEEVRSFMREGGWYERRRVEPRRRAGRAPCGAARLQA